MKSLSRALLTMGALTAVAFGGALVAHSAESADEQQSLVEDFGYPNRDRILQDDNVRLVSGDGHIVYTPCVQQPANGIGLIEVRSSDLSVGKDSGLLCFKVTGTSGYLTMLVPDVYEIRGDGFGSTPGHKGTAEVSGENGAHRTVQLEPNRSQQVGIGRPNGTPETLVRLEIKP